MRLLQSISWSSASLIEPLCNQPCYRACSKSFLAPWDESQERSDRIDSRFEFLLVDGYRCFIQALCQAERMIDNKKWLQKSELNKIKAECDNECCNPCADEMHCYEVQRLEHGRERLPKYDKEGDCYIAFHSTMY